jgi:hypothetical protein
MIAPAYHRRMGSGDTPSIRIWREYPEFFAAPRRSSGARRGTVPLDAGH